MRTHLLFAITLLGTFVLAQETTQQPSGSTAPESKVLQLKGFDAGLMDKTADPCVDFYQYSCGGWLKANPVPADQSSYGRDTELAERNRLILRDILEKASVNDPKRSAVDQKIGDFYSACMDEAAIEKKGLSALQPLLDHIAAIKSKADFAPAIADLHLKNVDALFSYGSDQDFKNANDEIAEADQGGLGLPERDYYTRTGAKDEEIRKLYLQHVTNMFKLLGESQAQAEADAHTVMRIETALANASLNVVDRREPANLYHKMPVKDLESMNPAFNWAVYMHAIGTPPVNSLNVAVPKFFKGLDQVLQQSSLDDIKTYLRWQTVHAMAPMMSSAFVNENFNFYGKTLQGAQELQPRWKRCVRFTDRNLGEALGHAYVDRTFGVEGKTRTLTMVHDIENAMQKRLEELDWMTPQTKQRAQEKLHAVVNKIGYPDKWRDYSKYEVIRGDALGNFERGAEFESRRQINKIGKPVDRGEWGMSPPTVNAYYNPQMNDINFPAGILQPPFYDNNMDDAVNYGDSGGIIGHELTHAFDDEGRQFDAKGNLEDWWTPQDAKQFEHRVACVVNEYNGFIATDDVHVNGKLTLGENVADLGGLKLAWMAYLAHAAGLDQKPQAIDGFNPDQRFFLSYGQGWCENYTPESLRLLAQTNPHAPVKSRVNGVVVNLPEFRKAFACKVGALMAPEKTCSVW
jgi:endothelin-converting enzyme/putative endopeptidase